MSNIVLRPEHLTMMMVANAGDYDNSSPAAAGHVNRNREGFI